MKKILSLSILVVFLLSGCATKAVRLESSPGLERVEVIKRSLMTRSELELKNHSEELAKDYLIAQNLESEGNKRKACSLFEDLAANKNFPLNEVALIHTLSDCTYSSRELTSIWNKVTIPAYAQEAYYEQSRLLAVANKLPLFEAEFSYLLIPFKKIQQEKIKLIKRAIEIAQSFKENEKVTLYFAKLAELSPMHASEINKENIYSVARDLESNRQFEKARELYKQIIDGDFTIEEKIKAFNAYRTSFKVARNLKTFLEKTYEMEKFLKDEMEKKPDDTKTVEGWADTKIALARAVWTNHENSKAREIIKDFIDSKKGNANQQAQAHYVYGSIHLESKENEKAVKIFEAASKFKITDQSLLENIQWATVWNNYLLKKDDVFLEFADQFLKKTNNSIFAAKLNFWKAKVLQRQEKNDDAVKILEEITTNDTFGYYGILASMELGRPLSPIPPSIINKESTGNITLDWLIALDEKPLSQKLLKEIDSKFKKKEDRERAMSYYALTEWYQGGMRQIYNFRQDSRNALTEKYISVIFPTPYLKAVEELSAKYSVHKELVYAITRQESAFVASERSWADAFGLMQMIPEKATELSKKFSIPYKDFNDLYIPETNLEMGTSLLKLLHTKFQGKFAQTVAAYNASEDVIKVWEKERFNGDYFEFIENIPYEETRNYIKLVFRNYITYKRVLSAEPFVVDKDFFAKPF